MTAPAMTREAALQDLPFLVNGTLTGAERVPLEALLSDDADLVAERDFLVRLRATMQADGCGQAGVNPPGELGLARLMRALPPQEAPRRADRWRAQGRLALVAGLAAVASALITAWALRDPAAAPVYVQASGDAGDAPVLTVTFQPEARLADIAALLQDKDLIIVDGPGALGLYRLELPPGADALALAETLRAADDLVLSVDEPE